MAVPVQRQLARADGRGDVTRLNEWPCRSTDLRCSNGWPGESFDVLVIGGGVTGVGVALDAASRGLRTALVEADDFASGTSSKSSKLVHGGLRYLQNGDVRLVYQALRERKRLRRNAPHLVQASCRSCIPILTKDGMLAAARRPRPRRGDVDVRPHRRLAHRQVPQATECRRSVRPPADDAPRTGGRRLPLLRRHRRRRPPRADDRPDRRRSRRRGRQPLPRSSALTRGADGQGVEPRRRHGRRRHRHPRPRSW